ncbi:TPA: hypothetical protein ACH3X3_014206 [Trebouxia sp. C0006]
MSRESRSVIRGHLHEGTTGHLHRVCTRLRLRANDCSRSQLIEKVLDDACQQQGAYRLLSKFNFDSLVEIWKMSDGRALLPGIDSRCVMVKILMRWEQWTIGDRRSRSGTEDTDPQSCSLGSRSPPREPVLPPAVSEPTPWEVEPVPAKPRQEGPPKEPRPRSWARGVHGPQVREPDEGAGLMPGLRSDDVGKRGLPEPVHLEDRAAKVPRLATSGGSGAVALHDAPDTLQPHQIHLTMPHTPVVPEMSHPAPNLEPLSAEPDSASRGEGGAGSPRAGSDAAELPQSYAAEQDQAYKSSHLQHHSDSEAEERGTLQAWYPGAAALSTQSVLTTAGGNGALVSQSNEDVTAVSLEGMCPAWLVDSSTLLLVPSDHANTTTAAGQQVATESDLGPASTPGAIPGAAPRPASRLGPAPGPVPEDDTTLATRPSLESAIILAPDPGSKGPIHALAPDLGPASRRCWRTGGPGPKMRKPTGPCTNRRLTS